MALTLRIPPSDLNYNSNPIYVEFETDLIDQVNHSCYLEVYKVLANGDEELKVILEVPFASNNRAFFYLKDIIDLGIPTPVGLSMKYRSQNGLEFGTAFSAFSKLRLKYSDKFGDIPVVENLVQSPTDYMILKGGTRLNNWVYIETLPQTVSLLHAYVKQAIPLPEPITKPIYAEQPDWAYILCGGSGDYDIYAECDLVDGSMESHLLKTISLEAGNVYWIQSGPSQLNLNTINSEKCAAYRWQIRAVGNSTAIQSISYSVIETCQDWGKYYIFFNGMGGMETFPAFGKNTNDHVDIKSTFKRVRSFLHNATEGDYLEHNISGYRKSTLNTGFLPLEYAEHLRAIKHGELFYLRFDNSRFERWLIDPSSMNISKDDDDLFALSFNGREAWDDRYQVNY